MTSMPAAAAAFLALLSLASAASAQRAPCFSDEAIPGWVADDLELGLPGASRPLPPEVPGDFELCSDATGFGEEEDGYRYVVRRAAGDFVFEEAVLSIDALGMAGVVARFDERSADAAHVRIAVHVTSTGFELRSGLRLAQGGLAVVAPEPVPVALPVWLRIERVGDAFTTSWSPDGIDYEEHLAVDATGQDLERGVLVVGMVQASESTGTQRAIFGEAGFVPPDGLRPDPTACVDDFAIPTTGGSEIELRGQNMHAVTGVTLAGVRAEIVSQGPRSLLVRAAPLPAERAGGASPVRSGDVVVESPHGAQPLGTRVVYAGVPFLRGDVDGSGRVGRRDLLHLLLALFDRLPVSCLEAADVNADRRVDGADWIALLRFLFLRGEPPPAPFPEPGFAPDGGRACGLPEAPLLTSVRRARDAGEAVLARFGTRRPRVREGDVLVVEGRGLPADPGRVAIRFGNVRTEVLPDSTPDAIRVLVLTVPDGGRKCPLVLEDTAERTPPVGVATPRSRFGVAYEVGGDPLDHLRLCPEFLPSELAARNIARLRRDGVSLFLPIDRASWDPRRPVEVDLSVPLPLVNGVSRGAREISFSFYAPPLASATPGVPPATPDYPTWLERLAARIDRELAGGRSDDACGECDAKAYVEGDGVVIAPCDPVVAWGDPGTCCDPPAPFGPGTQLEAPPGPMKVGTAFVPVPSECENGIDPEVNPRLFVWCEFEKIIRTSQGTGLPRWESYVPLTNLLQGPGGLAEVEHPDDRTIAEKEVMFSTDAFYEAVEHGYTNACQAAAAAYYCVGGPQDWMPPFSEPQRAVKTFWLRDEKLPPSLDSDELYNYVDPGGVRQNLVGMHVNLSTGDIPPYWRWSTFFAPRLVGETLAKDGTPLAWNDACTAGHIADQPVEIEGVWESYFMCTQGAPGEDTCGNPWGPPNECRESTCSGCHATVGQLTMDKSPFPDLAMAWFPTLTDAEIVECFDAIKAANEEEGVELYKSWAPEECQ